MSTEVFLIHYERHPGLVWTKEITGLDNAYTELRVFRAAGMKAWMELPALERPDQQKAA